MKLHLKAERPLLYLSGTGSYGMGEIEMIKAGAKYRCFSYAYVCPGGFYYQRKMEEAMDVSVKHKLGIMMDSSAHSFHKLVQLGLRKKSGKFSVKDIDKLRDQTIKQYAEFVLKYQKNWDWQVTFDYTKDCATIYKMTDQLRKLGVDTVPVFHGDQPLEWLNRYCEDGHKIVCLGSVKRNYKNFRWYFSKCFEIAEKHNVLLHGLAITSLSNMFGFPWYSVDSATWAKVAAFGCILCTSLSVNDTFGYLHVTDRRHNQSRGVEYMELSPEQKKEVKKEVEESGFDMDELIKDGAVRSLYNVWFFSNKIDHLRTIMREGRTRWKSLLPV